jgi:hypothetical protein
MVGAPCIIIDVEIELMKICGPFMMAVIMKFSLCLHELQRLMISVDICLLPKNVIPRLVAYLYNGIHLFFISGVLTNSI